MSSRRKEKLAEVISLVFLPPFMTFSIMVIFSFVLEDKRSDLFTFIGAAFFFTVIIPIGVFIYLRKKNKVGDNEARRKEERNVPYLFSILILLTGFLAIGYLDITLISKALFFTYIVSAFFILLINGFWKISAHLLSVGAPVGASLTAYIVTGYTVFVIAGILYISAALLLSWARLVLKCHTPAQLAAGFFTGFLINGGILYIIVENYGII